MDIRYSVNQSDFKYYTTEQVRKEFLLEKIFAENTVNSFYSHVDRVVIFGCMPTTENISLDKDIDVWKNFGTKYLLERRELGIFNVGGKGSIIVDDSEYILDYKDCLYVSMGSKNIMFKSENAATPAKYYMVSTPAHKICKTTFLSIDDAKKVPCGSMKTANARTINQFIHPDVLETCQLSMGMTALNPGSVWNTMPAHTHERRMEVYFYFEVPQDDVVFHMMGQPQETRHIVMKNEQAVISPSWSIHAGCGTSDYIFIWAMAGENKAFEDMDNLKKTELR